MKNTKQIFFLISVALVNSVQIQAVRNQQSHTLQTQDLSREEVIQLVRDYCDIYSVDGIEGRRIKNGVKRIARMPGEVLKSLVLKLPPDVLRTYLIFSMRIKMKLTSSDSQQKKPPSKPLRSKL